MLRTFLKRFRWPAILLGLWLISLAGIHSIPLEDHEVFVLQTTQEMRSRGDWVLPSFNYEPRLKKPPFNYWATATLSHLDPFSDGVRVWHGRMVSLLAGLAMVLATYCAGRTLYGPATGKLASLLLLGMQGYVSLLHSARPDFLYSAFCGLQLFAWIYAWKAEDGSTRQRLCGWLGWIMAGLATLTKGPQGPAVFLAGMLIFLLSGPDRRRVLKVLRPFFGIGLLLLLVLPWWIMLRHQLATMHVDIAQTQLSGSLLKNLAGWREILSGYYLWTLLSLMAPASLLLPFLAPRLWRCRREAGAPTRIMLYACAVLLVVFTLGGHYRKHYLLPLLPIFALFLAHAVHTGAYAGLQGRWKRILTGLFWTLAAFCLAMVFRAKDFGTLAGVALVAVPLFLLLRQELELPEWTPGRGSTQLVTASAAVAILTIGFNAYLPKAVTRWRTAEQAFARHVGETLQPADLIVQWKSDTSVLPFYARRPVPVFGDLDALRTFFGQNHPAHRVYAVLPRTELPVLSAALENRTLETIQRARHPEDDLVFVELTGLPAGAGAAPNP